MPPTRTSWKTRVACLADVVFFLLLCVAILIEVRGGVKWRVGSLYLTARSITRPFLLAVLVLVVRHTVVPRPSIVARVLAALRGLRPYAVRSVPSLAQRLRARWNRSDLQFELPAPSAWLWAFLLFGGGTTFMLRQQLLAYTNVPDLGDPLFSMWRLGWVAHQLPLDPSHLFDANIFHPAARTLAYSDAMLLPALMAAPALWLGAPLAVVYTSLLLFSYVAAGVAMFVLANGVTRHAGAASIAGLVFAFDPFRFAHYSHLEMQFTFCMPLAVFFLLRTLATGSRRDGALAGVFVALQGLSSLYYGAYLAVSLVVLVLCWICLVNRVHRCTILSLGLALGIATAVGLLITLPYWANRRTVGERGPDEIREYSATGRDYLTADRRSDLYGTWLRDPNNGERKLFPGTLPVVLGAAALLPPVGPVVVPAAITLAVCVDASLGLHGTIYTWLYDLLPPFRGFRVPARFRAIAGLYIALLTGLGVAGLARRIPPVWPRRVALTALGILVLVDLRATLQLQPLWDHAPGIYRFIPDRHATLADLPLPWDRDPVWHDPVYMYFSTFHWHPIVNGGSGFEPPWYDRLGSLSRDFPSDETLDAYRQLGTEYFVLHEGYYGAQTFKRVVSDIEAQPRLRFVATVTWEEGECRLYRLLW